MLKTQWGHRLQTQNLTPADQQPTNRVRNEALSMVKNKELKGLFGCDEKVLSLY